MGRNQVLFLKDHVSVMDLNVLNTPGLDPNTVLMIVV